MYNLFAGHPVIPVVVLPDPDQAVPVARALRDGGIGIIEVTFRTAAAAEAIARIRAELPDMAVGAGTVVIPDQARQAIAAGALFGLAPGFDAHTVGLFHEQGLPFVPGVATPTDIQAALRAGCRHLKFFPAATLGGPDALKAIAAPYASLGIRFCPTGGITPANLPAYLAIPAVFAVGGTWLVTPDDLATANYPAITAKAAQAVRLATP